MKQAPYKESDEIGVVWTGVVFGICDLKIFIHRDIKNTIMYSLTENVEKHSSPKSFSYDWPVITLEGQIAIVDSLPIVVSSLITEVERIYKQTVLYEFKRGSYSPEKVYHVQEL
jgi:hypothetical protein